MYRILRNNKEQGPYNLDELVQLKLRPYDLIWVEGKSACWRYPTEIEDLKSYVIGATPATITPEPLPQPALPTVTHTIIPDSEAVMVQEENEITAEMLEQKANAIYQRIQAYNEKNEQEAKDVQTKYARSLEDLKQDYADWLHGKKHKKRETNLNYKGWIAFGAVSAVFILFVLAGKNKEIVWPVYKQKDAVENKAKADKPKERHQYSAPVESKTVMPQQVSDSQRTTMEAFIDSMRKVLHKDDAAGKDIQDKIAKKKSKDSQLTIHPVLPSSPIEDEVPKVPIIKAAELDGRYVPGENSTRIKEIHITVQNTGTVKLKQVAVNVFYYKKGDRLVDSETIYFSDISPGNSSTLNKQGSKKAVTARFELGELTADN